MKDKLIKYLEDRSQDLSYEIYESLISEPEDIEKYKKERNFIENEAIPWLSKQKNPPYEVPEEIFEQFWKLYPNKTGKAPARKAFSKVVRDTKDRQGCIDLIFKAVVAQRAPGEPLGEDRETKYIKHASTWLNQRIFEDELPEIEVDESSMTLDRAQELKRKAGIK